MSVIIKTMGGGAAKEDAFAYINVTYPVGASCSCTNGVKTLTAKDTSGKYVFEIPSAGDWTVKAALGEDNVEETLTINDKYEAPEISLNFFPDFVMEVKETELGGSVTIDGIEWIVVDKDISRAVLASKDIYSLTPYNQFSYPYYKTSTLSKVAQNFEDTVLSTETKKWLNDVTMEEVTAKVFVPSDYYLDPANADAYEWYAVTIEKGSGFLKVYEYPNRACNYQGSPKNWWVSNRVGVERTEQSTDSYKNLGAVRSAASSGTSQTTQIGYIVFPQLIGNNWGFRPHMEVKFV